jgi:transaldolase
MLDTPLLRTARLGPTDYWNDSCAVDELAYAIERGATGSHLEPLDRARGHPQGEGALGSARPPAGRRANPTWSEVELTWAIIEEMAVRGAAKLAPIHEEYGRRGWLSVQTNPANYRDPARMVEQAVRFAGLAPNLHVKFPATSAGMVAIEEATAKGVSINATVSFTVPQAIAAAEAVERGLKPVRGRRRRCRKGCPDRHHHDRPS